MISLNKFAKDVHVLWFLLNPDCRLGRMLDSFVKAFICHTAISSTIFDIAGKIGIGLICSTFLGYVTLGNGTYMWHFLMHSKNSFC